MSISKKLRFETFERDEFVCQYCGKSPPEVVLEIDHVVPKSKNGGDVINNLTTSCADCNKGKSNIELKKPPNTIKKNLREIDIVCETGINIEWRKLQNYQGELKELTKDNFEKFKNLIIKDGFAAPIFIWKGKNYILDGHQRIRVLGELTKNGFIDPVKLPCVNVRCRDKKHAKRLILGYASQFGTMTDEGFYQFIHESDLIGDFDEIVAKTDLKDIDYDYFKKGYIENLSYGDMINEEIEGLKGETRDENNILLLNFEEDVEAFEQTKKLFSLKQIEKTVSLQKIKAVFSEHGIL